MNAGGGLNTCKSNENLRFGGEESGARVRNTWVINPLDRNNPGKLGLIPDVAAESSGFVVKGAIR
eukprot:CAMPEP_0205916422 /NCGR_PEP_ID=MMETSP1325-20131115/8486_1 /ASSEMBLY_ACC=CAM_ASM_000708 /TAXON_ID=236786 /ORGANISM="Florenciella sp., Strain RCC1007" /LENGTH=64 /DNA_ID=CAMNT_0053283693 /DNA_START=15 /DNA_END=209 /DNA_ORIENTATION=+